MHTRYTHRPTARSVILALFAVLALVAVGVGGPAPSPAGAQATDTVEEAAASLRRDPVFVDPEAERALTDDEADEVRDAVRDAGRPVFVAVLPASAGDADVVLDELRRDTGLSGTYAVVVGDSFRAASTELASADEAASAAFQAASGEGTAAVLVRFVDEVAAAGTGGAPVGDSGDRVGDGGADDDASQPSLLPLALLAGGGGGLWVWWRRRRRRQQAEDRARLTADVELLRAEMSVLADDVLRLEPEVVLHPEARDDYEAAVERHRVASAALDYADEPLDLIRLERVVDEARYAMARARALVEGREPPPPPDQLRRPGRHQEPPLVLDEVGTPVYAGGQPFYGGGWFGGGGGLFSGLLLGSMLGGGWGWGGWGGPVIINEGGDGGDGGDGFGGFGGGDFGGGDFGGGDWGGGDIGGGDW